MNKLIQVNIGGMIFQIDELAYHKLDAYLNSIKRRYASSADGDEIVKDIEARIAELFTEKFKDTNAAVMDADVEEIIAVMGKPEDYEGDTSSEQKSHTSQQTHKSSKFYRDKDNDFLGGVCAGFAAKFNIDALWIRLAFLVAFFFFGTGLLLYIILWIIMPEAKTTAEKLEMRGEKVNIDNIEKTVKEGAAQFKTKMNEFGEEVKQTFSRENVNKTKKNVGDLIEGAVETVKPVFNIIARIIVFAIMVVCLIVVVVIGIELFTNWGNSFSNVQFFGSHIGNGGNQAWLLVTSAIALVIIPLVGIIFSSIKYLTGVKRKTKYVSTTLGILWTLCLITVIWLGITIGREFRYEGNSTERFNIAAPAGEMLYVKLESPVSTGNWHHHHEKWDKLYVQNDTLIFQNIHVDIEKSADTLYTVIIHKSARGASYEDAEQHADDFNFGVFQTSDSVLIIPSSIRINEDQPWRDQEVYITVRVPQDKYVMIDKTVDEFMDDNEYTSDLKEIELYGNKLRMTPGGLKPVY